MTTAKTRRLTFEEWQALPETTRKCEVLDGVVVMPPSPFGEHQWVVKEILIPLDLFLSSASTGIAITSPYDVLVSRDPLRVRQPDILVVNEALTGITRPADLAGLPHLQSPPCGGRGPFTQQHAARHRGSAGRLPEDRGTGVWLASFLARTIQVLNLNAEGGWVATTYGIGDVLRSEVLPGFELAVDDIYGPLLIQE